MSIPSITTSSYLNLGLAGDFHPSLEEATNIKSTLLMGSAANLNASFEQSGDLTVTDPLHPTNSITIKKSGLVSEATKLSIARQFSITGDISTPTINFDGRAAVPLIATIGVGKVLGGMIGIAAVTSDKLSIGSPVWTPSGNLSITTSYTSDISFNIGDKRKSDNSSTINFQSQGATSPISNASISRGSGIDGALTIMNSGMGSTIVQTGGSNTRVVIDSAGRVGIGTGSNILSYPLQVESGSSSVNPAIYIAPSNAGYSKLLLGSWLISQEPYPQGTNDFYVTNPALSTKSIYVRASNGKVGIGTDALISGSALTVDGNVSATTFIGAVTGTASGNIKQIGSSPITVDSSNPASLTVAVGGAAASSVWPINVSGVAQGSSVPPGAIMAFAMNSAPAGWIAADGSSVNRAGTYADLFTAIGTLYGFVSSSTFNLPDLRGYFVRGFGANSDGATSGVFGIKQVDEFKSHTHSLYENEVLLHPAVGDTGIARFNDYFGSGPKETQPIGGGETRPRNIAMLYCIKY